MTDDGNTDSASQGEPTEKTIVETAANAAEDVIFSRVDASRIDDIDVTITFEDDVLEVDIYLNAPDARVDTDTVVDDAGLAARSAVDDLLEG